MANINISGSISTTGTSILGNATVNITSNTDHTLSVAEYTNQFIRVTSDGSILATRNVIAPVVQGQTFLVQNATTEGYSIQLIGTAGTGITILPNTTALVTCDGTNYISPTAASLGSAGGDLAGTYPSPTVINITGSASIATVSPGTKLNFGTNPSITGLINLPSATIIKTRNAANSADISLLGTDGSNNIFLGGGLNDGYVALNASTGNLVKFQVASNDIITISNNTLSLASTGTAYTISQASLATNSATANTLTIGAQNATGTNSIGGNLNLNSGSGTNIDGYVNIQTGGVTQLSVLPSLFQIANSGTVLTGNVAISGVLSSALGSSIVLVNGNNIVNGGANFNILAAGQRVQFSSQPGVDYFIAFNLTGSSFELTAAYTGTNSSTASATIFPNQLNGTGTLFTKQCIVGQSVSISSQQGFSYIISSIQSDTQLTFTTNYNGIHTSSSVVSAVAYISSVISQSPLSSDAAVPNIVISGQNAFSGATNNINGGNIIFNAGMATTTASKGGSVIALVYPIANSSAPTIISPNNGKDGSFAICNGTNFSSNFINASFSVNPYGISSCRVFIGADGNQYIDSPIGGQLSIEALTVLTNSVNGQPLLNFYPLNTGSITLDNSNISPTTSIQFASNTNNPAVSLNAVASDNLARPLVILSQNSYASATSIIAGSCFINNGSPTLDGYNTFFVIQLVAGQTITISGVNYIILNITNNTTLTLTTNYSGVTILSPGVAITSNIFHTNGAPLRLLGGGAYINGSNGLRGGVQLQLGADNNETLIEIVEPILGQRVVSLAQIGSGITSTQMPANTGDGVIWVGNAATTPGIGKPVGGGILHSFNGAANWKDGYGTSIALSPLSNGIIVTQLGRISDYISYGTITSSGGTLTLTIPLPTSTSTAKLSIDALAKVTAASINTGSATVGDMYGETAVAFAKNVTGSLSALINTPIVAMDTSSFDASSAITIITSGTNAVITLTLIQASGSTWTNVDCTLYSKVIKN